MALRALHVAALCLAGLRVAEAHACAAASGSCQARPVGQSPVVLMQQAVKRRRADSGRVLYMVKSYKGFYETKLRAVLRTWGSLLSQSSLLVLGDEEWSEFPVHRAPMCESDSTQGLSCRVAYGMTLAAKHPGNWSWLFVVDDDHYVRPSMVDKALGELDASRPIGAGCYGCGQPMYCEGNGGFCGGCGYAFSRAAVLGMVGADAEEFQRAHSEISHSAESDGREDMAISCALRKRVPALEVQQMTNMHGEAPDIKELSRRWRTDDSIAWHHIGPETMEEMHAVFKNASP